MNDYQEWCKTLFVSKKDNLAVLPTKVKKTDVGNDEPPQSVEVLKERVKNNLETIQLLRDENVRLEREIEMRTTLVASPRTSIEKVIAVLNELRNKWEDNVSIKYPDFFYDGKMTSNFMMVNFYSKNKLFPYDFKTSFMSQRLEIALFPRKYQQKIEKNPQLAKYVANLPTPPSLQSTEEFLQLLDETGTVVTFRSFAFVYEGEERTVRGDEPVAYWGPDYKEIQNRFRLRKQ